MITPSLLQAVGAGPKEAQLFAPLLEDARHKPGDSFETISSRKGVAMLVSQLAHESGGFSRLSENLNYSASALMEGNRAKYFTPIEAHLYGYIRTRDGSLSQKADQRMIAKLYYGGRLGNLGTHTEDGWTFRGAGLIQLTGRANFTAFGEAVKMSPEEAAEYCRTPQGAVASALWYWRTRGLLVPASKGDVETCTKLINGGTIGLSSREELYRKALFLLG